jgi:hypothetical protein
MQPLSTPVIPKPITTPLTHADRIVSLGSCFVENIGSKLESFRFDLCANPTGILYNPAAINRALLRLIDGTPFTADELFQHNGLWCSFQHHGSYSHPDQQTALAQINADFERAAEQLNQCTCLLLTFGTAFAWYHKEEPEYVVANCHKLPTAQFERRMIPAHEIALQLGQTIKKIKTTRPDLQVILTVSPVRHLRQNAAENSLSKAQLITACHQLSAEIDGAHHFPAYEIMIDELRDYRFYARDLVHPSELAQAIIWERFRDACVHEKSRQFISDYTPILNMQNHRPLHPDTPTAVKFAQTLAKKIADLRAKYPAIPIPQ